MRLRPQVLLRSGALVALTVALVAPSAPAPKMVLDSFWQPDPHRAPNANVGTTRHLYVAVNNGIMTFPMSDGLPSLQSDFDYPVADRPITVAGDGTVYGTVTNSSGVFIDAFAHESATPSRQIIPYLCGQWQTPQALAVDAVGNLYVGYSIGVSGLSLRSRRPARCRVPQTGVLVYGPKANGNKAPALVISTARESYTGPFGLTFGGGSNLFVSLYDAQCVEVFTHPAVAPTQRIRMVCGTDSIPSRIAIEAAAGDMYIVAWRPPSGPSVVDVYRVTARGSHPPNRTLAMPDAGVDGIAVERRYLLVTDSAQNAVLAFDRRESGSPAPVFTLPLPNSPSDLALGP